MAKTITRRNGKTNGQAHTSSQTTNRIATLSDGVPDAVSDRLPVLKTYKIFIGGKFPRTESGRFYIAKGMKGEPLANVCNSSRKDFREAVVAARAAQVGWAARSAYNRSQILYRIAEMLEGRSAQFVEELIAQGAKPQAAKMEVSVSIDRLLYYAGWCDKYQQVFSSVNPVASSHFNFSILEPTGVVSVFSPQMQPLLGIVSTIAPLIAGGNTCIALASTDKPLAPISFTEVLATSDLPGGVVNILTGYRSELIDPMSNHMDVNAVVYCGNDLDELKKIRTNASLNVKRVLTYDQADWSGGESQSPYFIVDAQETKTTWHPIGI